MECLTRRYPELEDWYVRCRHQFDNYIIRTEKDEFHPKRGVGLGYFTPLKSIVVWSILQGLDILASFDDDMLIKDSDYKEACDRIKS